MNPIVDYAATVIKYAPDLRYYPRSLLYLLKLAVWEPFRYAERVAARRDSEPRTLREDPVIVLGYYRSGTTHLQETLLRDPRFGYMNFYQGFFPTAFTSTERWVKPVFERVIQRVGMLHPAHGIPFSFALPAEEDVAMVASGSRLAANWGQVLPRDFKEIYTKTGLLEGISASEWNELRAQMHDLVWRVSVANGHKRLVLKSPPQIARVRMLLEMYPNAKFVFIRRNPYDVFASNKKLWKSFGKTWLQDVDADTVREYILWSYDACHRAYERDRALFRPGQLSEIAFEDFRAQPVATLAQIYAQLDLGDFRDVQPIFADYLAQAHQASQPAYALSRVEREAIASRWGSWLAKWGYDVRNAEVAA